MAGRRFATLDVFTDRPLAGNPLAVVLEAEGLDDAAMQAVAAEFNLSETVFVRPARETRHRAALRIFTPRRELPFAGHPTIGTAVLLALEDRAGREGAGLADAVAFGLEEAIGTVACLVETGEGRGRARFRIPSLPRFVGDGPDADTLTPLLGLPAAEIGFRRHAPSRHDAGNPFTFVPLAHRAALDAVKLERAAFARLHGEGALDALFLYAPDPEELGTRFQARMFAPNLGVDEDPATGSAAAAFAGVMMQFEPLGDGAHDVAITQGVAMGRPSAIALQLTIEGGALHAAEIAGSAVLVSQGRLHV